MATEHTQEKTVERAARRTARRRDRIQNNGRPSPETASFVAVGGRVPSTSEVRYRIAGTTKWLMLLVALFFDLFPLLALVTIVVITLSTAGVSMDTLVQANAACGDKTKVAINLIAAGKCAYYGGATLVFGGLSAIAALWFLGPVVYLATSFLSAVLAILLFFAWFSIKKVPYFSLKSGRLQVALFTLLVEVTPFTSWLPGITFLTWRQIRISRKEDKEKVSK